jgi:hypothetical protein
MTKQLREVTPEDSFVPVYEEIWTEKELAQREVEAQAELDAQVEAQAEARALKVSAYTKLGLTEDEINAIIGAQ